MFKSFEISHFRGFAEISIAPLSAVNLITGKNGAGKTSFLEAIFMNAGAANPNLVVMVNSFREGGSPLHAFSSQLRQLFSEFDSRTPASINAVRGDHARRLTIQPIVSERDDPTTSDTGTAVEVTGISLDFTGPSGSGSGLFKLNPPEAGFHFQMPAGGNFTFGTEGLSPIQLQPPFTVISEPQKDVVHGHFVSPYQSSQGGQMFAQLAELVKSRKVSEIVEIVRIVDERVKDLIPLADGKNAIIYADIGETQLYPVSVFGGGFLHIMRIALTIASTPVNGMLIVDEIENGVHYSAHERLASIVIGGCRARNIQCFVSTHSAEMIRAFASVAKLSLFTDMSIVRFAKSAGTQSATVFDQTEFDTVFDLDGEFR